MTQNNQVDLRAEVIRLNSNALIALMDRYGFTLSARDFPNWRPTTQVSGTLTGLEPLGSLTILCTDGCLAVFLKPDGQLLTGHVSNFDGEVKPLHSTPPPHKEKPSRPRPKASKTPRSTRVSKASVQDAIALLQSLIQETGQDNK